jgi:hypothetical protein
MEDTGMVGVREFRPKRTPGSQLDAMLGYTPLDLFKLFFTSSLVDFIISCTSDYFQKVKAAGKKYNMINLTRGTFYSFISITIFMGLVQLPRMQDYWADDGFLVSLLLKKVHGVETIFLVFCGLFIFVGKMMILKITEYEKRTDNEKTKKIMNNMIKCGN